MAKRMLLACLTFMAVSAQAAPLSFFNVQLGADAIALTDGPAGIDSQSSPPGESPVVATAVSIGTANDIATAGAIADTGLLVANADVSGFGDVTSAVSTARFSGSILNGGWLILNLGLETMDSASGTGLSGASLFATLTSGGVTLFSDLVTGTRVLDYFLAPGTTSLLELTLSSEASAGFPAAGSGNAFSFGQVTFNGTVPTPATWLLFLVGAGAMLVVRRRA